MGTENIKKKKETLYSFTSYTTDSFPLDSKRYWALKVKAINAATNRYQPTVVRSMLSRRRAIATITRMNRRDRRHCSRNWTDSSLSMAAFVLAGSDRGTHQLIPRWSSQAHFVFILQITSRKRFTFPPSCTSFFFYCAKNINFPRKVYISNSLLLKTLLINQSCIDWLRIQQLSFIVDHLLCWLVVRDASSVAHLLSVKQPVSIIINEEVVGSCVEQ